MVSRERSIPRSKIYWFDLTTWFQQGANNTNGTQIKVKDEKIGDKRMIKKGEGLTDKDWSHVYQSAS